MRAVDGVELRRSARGETLGLVGESGCGKTTHRRACCIRLIEPTAGTRRVRRRGSARARREGDAAPDAPRHADHLPGPVRSLNPRMTVGDIIAEPLRHPRRQARCRRRARSVARAARAWSACRATPPTAIRTNSPAASASASASRARWRCSPSFDRLRRAGLGARRLDPGADRQPAAGPAARLRPDLSVHRARSRVVQHISRPRRGDVSRQDRRDRRQAHDLRQPAASLHAGADCRRAGAATRKTAAAGAARALRATCRARSIRRRAAAFTRAARS